MKGPSSLALLFLGSCCAILGRWEEPDTSVNASYPNGHPLLEVDPQHLESLAYERRTDELVGNRRAELGLRPLARSAYLNAVARAHARHMIEHDFKSHDNPEGDDPEARVRRAGGEPCRVGENIAWEWVDAEGAYDFWIHSPPHREAIDDPRWTTTGIGAWRKTQGALTYYVAQVFVE